VSLYGEDAPIKAYQISTRPQLQLRIGCSAHAIDMGHHPAIWIVDVLTNEVTLLGALKAGPQMTELCAFLDAMVEQINTAITYWETKPHEPHERPDDPSAPEGPTHGP
jgi:hypothetical protein